MAQPPKWLTKTIGFIDKYVGELSGKVFFVLVFPMAGAASFEVVMRYGFNSPTIWAYDVTWMLYGSHFMLGATYCLHKGGHIRTDLIYEKLPVRWQGWIDSIAYIIFFFPGMILFFRAGFIEAVHSWDILEKSFQTAWYPPIYPFKTVIPFTAVLLMAQGASECLKSVYAALRGEWL